MPFFHVSIGSSQNYHSQNDLWCLFVPLHLAMIKYNYPPKGRWIVVDIYQDEKCWGIYPPLFTDPEGIVVLVFTKSDGWKNAASLMAIISSSETFVKWSAIFLSVRKTGNNYPRIFQVTGDNQNTRKLLSTDLVNTNNYYNYW